MEKEKMNNILDQYDELRAKCIRLREDQLKIRNELSQVLNDKRSLQAQLATFAPHAVGDKVTLLKSKNTGSMFMPVWVDCEAFIGKVITVVVDRRVSFSYGLNAVKVDGSMSKIRFNNWRTYASDDFKKIK